MMSDLRDSGSIEQDADVIMFLYRDDYYAENKEEPISENDTSAIEVIIAKNRHGSTGTVKMNFDKAYTRFYTIDNTGGAPPA